LLANAAEPIGTPQSAWGITYRRGALLLWLPIAANGVSSFCEAFLHVSSKLMQLSSEAVLRPLP
jgi:hypothetical protein